MIIHRVKRIKVHLSFVKNRRKSRGFRIVQQNYKNWIIPVLTWRLENKLGQSWAKLSGPTQLKLVDWIQDKLQFEEATKLVYCKNVYFQQVIEQEGKCRKESHCRFQHKCVFCQTSWSFEDIPFLIADSTKISQISKVCIKFHAKIHTFYV